MLIDEVDFNSGLNIEDEFIKTELKKTTHDCLKQLPIKYREPLSLYFLEEKTYEEISDIIRMPINTVGTHIYRAKILMKKICKKLKR